MKKKLNLIIMLGILLFACSDNEDEKINLDVQPTSYSFKKEGGTEILKITSNTDAEITVRSTETWCKVVLETISSTSRQYKITAGPNPLQEIRNAQIVVTTIGFEKQIPVTQEAGEKKDPIPEPEKYLVRENLTTQQLVDEMGLGINLGNTLDASGNWFDPTIQSNFETCWGSPIITKEIIEGYAKQAIHPSVFL